MSIFCVRTQFNFPSFSLTTFCHLFISFCRRFLFLSINCLSWFSKSFTRRKNGKKRHFLCVWKLIKNKWQEKFDEKIFLVLDEDTRGGKWIKCFVWKKLPKMSKVETFSLQTFSCGKSFSFLLIFYFHIYVYITFSSFNSRSYLFFFTFFLLTFRSCNLFYSEERTKIHFSLFFSFFFVRIISFIFSFSIFLIHSFLIICCAKLYIISIARHFSLLIVQFDHRQIDENMLGISRKKSFSS